MTSLLPVLVLFGAAAGLAYAVISMLISFLRRHSLDVPNARSSHTVPTPRGAGLALVPVVVIAWIALAIASSSEAAGILVWPALGAACLCALSWVDDLKGLPPLSRLGAHIIVIAALISVQPDDSLSFQGLLPYWLDRIATGFAWLWFVNLFNFMDGIDGISGIETVSIGIGIVIMTGMVPQIDFLSLPAAVLAGAAVGFLFLNWHPAKIFLGDSGSIPLGLVLGWLLIQLAAHGHLAAAIILPLYYLADATITISRRILRREKIWQAHRQHFYQRAVAAGATHGKISAMILVANMCLIALAILSVSHPWEALAAACAVTAVLLAWLRHRAASP